MPRPRQPRPHLLPLGRRIRDRRLELGLNQRELADRYGHHGGMIHAYEEAWTCPDERHIDELAAALELPRNELRQLAGYALVDDDYPPPSRERDQRLMELQRNLLRIRGELDAALKTIGDVLAA